MVKKLIQHGNSVALVIDKPIMEILNISNETTFKISTDGKNAYFGILEHLKRKHLNTMPESAGVFPRKEKPPCIKNYHAWGGPSLA